MKSVPAPLRTCTVCREPKSSSEFYVNDKATGRLFPWCKTCHGAKCKAIRERDPAAHNERVKRWQREHPEKAVAINRASKRRHAVRIRDKARAEYPEKRRPKQAAYRAANAGKIRVRNAVYRAAHQAEIKRYGKSYYLANKEAVDARIKKCIAANPDLYQQLHKAAKHRRKVRLTNNGPHEKFTDREIFERDNWTCHLCGGPVDPALKHPDPMSVSLDHVKPIANGGGHARANSATAHLRCNLAKRNLYERRDSAA